MTKYFALLTTLLVCSCATVPRSAAEEDPHYIAAAQLLACAPNDVHLSTTTHAPAVIHAEGCGRAVTFSEMCRNPGPYETAYLQSVPPPPRTDELERNYRASRESYSNPQRKNLDAYALQTAQARELQYGQGLADARMRDVGVAVQPEKLPREQLKLPDAWAAANCRIEQQGP